MDQLDDFNTQIQFIKSVFTDPHSEVLEIACGIGEHAFILAQEGYCVTAIDASKEMIESLKEKAECQGVEMATCIAALETFETCITGAFDGIFCIGNTMRHLKSEETITQFFKKLKKHLKSNGKVILQLSLEKREGWNDISWEKLERIVDESTFNIKHIYSDFKKSTFEKTKDIQCVLILN